MDTRVECVHGACRREFYECADLAADLEGARRQWAGWENTHNGIRPHERLAMRTPMECIAEQSPSAQNPEMS